MSRGDLKARLRAKKAALRARVRMLEKMAAFAKAPEKTESDERREKSDE